MSFDEAALEGEAKDVLREHPTYVEAYRNGETWAESALWSLLWSRLGGEVSPTACQTAIRSTIDRYVELHEACETVIDENPEPVSDYHEGESDAINFLVGQVMQRTEGRYNPKWVDTALRYYLDKPIHEQPTETFIPPESEDGHEAMDPYVEHRLKGLLHQVADEDASVLEDWADERDDVDVTAY